MKKFITLLFILTLGFSYSQENIAWNRVDLYVPANQAGAYLEAMDEFYSNIEMPEGVSVSLVSYFYKPKDVKATHSIVFAGPVDGIIELRQIRSGEGYEAFYDDLDVLDAKIVSNSSMGLNLSRGKPVKYYSSDRIAQLMGNGLLTFIDEKTHYNDFFSNKEIVTYKNLTDLNHLLQKYKKDKKQRKLIAKNGKIKYMKYFNSNIISKYIVEKTMDNKISKDYLWLK